MQPDNALEAASDSEIRGFGPTFLLCHSSMFPGTKDKMKQKIPWIAAAIIIAAASAAYYQYGNRERQFLNRAFIQLRGGGGSEPVADIKLESGETASVILEHDCCNGAGFDAVAVRTSDGGEFYSKKNYCGLEGFYPTVKGDAAKDLKSFKSFLVAQGYHKK